MLLLEGIRLWSALKGIQKEKHDSLFLCVSLPEISHATCIFLASNTWKPGGLSNVYVFADPPFMIHVQRMKAEGWLLSLAALTSSPAA